MPPTTQGGSLLSFAIEAGYERALVAKALKRFSRGLGVAEPGVEHAFDVS